MKKRVLLSVTGIALCIMLTACENMTSVSSDITETSQSSSAQYAEGEFDDIDAGKIKSERIDTWKALYQQKITLDELCETIRSSAVNEFDGNMVKCVDDTIVVNVWSNGLALAVATDKESNVDYTADWDTARGTMIDLSKAIREYIDDCGFWDMHLVMNVLNDLNHEKTLLEITDGSITIDTVAGFNYGE